MELRTAKQTEDRDANSAVSGLLSEEIEMPEVVGAREDAEERYKKAEERVIQQTEKRLLSPEEYVDRELMNIMQRFEAWQNTINGDSAAGIRYDIPNAIIMPALKEVCEEYLENCGIAESMADGFARMSDEEMREATGYDSNEAVAEDIINKALKVAIVEAGWKVQEADKESRHEEDGYVNRAGILSLDGEPLLSYTAHETGYYDSGYYDADSETVDIKFKKDQLKKVLVLVIEKMREELKKEQYI